MKRPTKRIALLIYKNFKLFWVLCSIAFLSVALIINWHLSYKRTSNEIQKISNQVSNNVDGLIEDLFQDLYTLPIYGNKIPDCKTGLFPYLQYITVNSTKISGLVISDKNHKLICSTLPKNESIINKSINPRTLSGPFTIALFEQPVYLVQQKMGKYYIGVIIFASVLESVMRPNAPLTDSVALYNQFEAKNIIRIVQSEDRSGWRFSKELDTLTPEKSESNFAAEPLQSIDHVDVDVYENQRIRIYHLWLSQIILSILLVLFSCLTYLITKNMLAKRYSLNNSLKLALKNNEFYPVYQPLYNVLVNQYTAVEVLLRWEDGRGKTIMPDTFIGEAESSGLIVPITLQIIETSFIDFASIFQTYPNFHLGFNLSAAHFLDPKFFTEFYALADKYQIKAHQVLFEITERDLIDKNDTLFGERMQELRTLGYSLAVDDYGTGHASISYLQHFPFDHLKIDKLFVQAIGTKAITESLNDAIIEMANRLNLLIIAEGVETKEQAEYLAAHGVRYLQGWYFSKALTIEQLNDVLRENHHGI